MRTSLACCNTYMCCHNSVPVLLASSPGHTPLKNGGLVSTVHACANKLLNVLLNEMCNVTQKLLWIRKRT